MQEGFAHPPTNQTKKKKRAHTETPVSAQARNRKRPRRAPKIAGPPLLLALPPRPLCTPIALCRLGTRRRHEELVEDDAHQRHDGD